MHKRKGGRRFLAILIAVLTLILVVFACACVRDDSFFGRNELSGEEKEILDGGLSVHFIDVGEGNCTVVKLPDGKVFMFDTGRKSDKSKKKIKSLLEELSVNKIDYLVLSHPDEEHTGGLDFIFENYSVERVYLPKVLFPENAAEFDAVYGNIPEENIFHPKKYDIISGDDYRFCFLFADSLVLKDPTEFEKDAISTVIYFEYSGVRFVFTSDTVKEVLSDIATDYYSGVLSMVFKKLGAEVNLMDVDYFSVGTHGGNSAFSESFFDLLSPKNAIISVGDNYVGHPSVAVIEGLFSANEECKLYRTDVFGTVSVLIDKNGKTDIKLER